MVESTGYICTRMNATGREVAEQFAAKFWDQPRTIACWDGKRFQLANGRRWYEVREHAMGNEVWLVGEDSE